MAEKIEKVERSVDLYGLLASCRLALRVDYSHDRDPSARYYIAWLEARETGKIVLMGEERPDQETSTAQYETPDDAVAALCELISGKKLFVLRDELWHRGALDVLDISYTVVAKK